jgi:hypothetical protein
MIKNQWFSVIVLAAFCAALPALAQTRLPRIPAPRVHPSYTVEFKTTHVQTLANGATITTETKEVMARDAEMRRMNSVTQAAVGDRPAVTTVHVNDPTTGDEISWNSASQVAHDIRRPVGNPRHGCWATPDGRYRAIYGPGNASSGVPPQPLQPPSPPAGAAAPVASPLAESGTAPRVISGGEGAAISGVVTSGSNSVALGNPYPGNVTREDLGADTIMGVEVHGSRTTTTTPPGSMGNDQPLVRTDVVWMAPSLGMALRSVSDDPQMGKTDREVVSVDLNNPDPSLFQPPAGYQLETEEMQPVTCAQ